MNLQSIGAAFTNHDHDENNGMSDISNAIVDIHSLNRATLRWLQEFGHCGLIVTDRRLRIRGWNRWMERHSGMQRESIDGQDLFDVFPELAERKLDRYYRGALEGKPFFLTHVFHQYVIPLRSPIVPSPFRYMLQSAHITPLAVDDQSPVIGTLTAIDDVTDRVHRENALIQELEHNRIFASLAEKLVSRIDLPEMAVLVLEHAQKLTQSPTGFVATIDRQTGHLVIPALPPNIHHQCHLGGMEPVRFTEFRGLWGWVLLQKTPVIANDPNTDPRAGGLPQGHIPIHRFMGVPVFSGEEVLGEIAVANSEEPYTSRELLLLKRMADLLAIAIDRKRLDDEIQRLALIDPLTQLANRRQFNIVAEKELKMAERLRTPLYVLFIDLDGMKWINDHLGHSAGDAALIETANLLKNCFRASDVIARIGGDEFAVLAMESGAKDANRMVERLKMALQARNEQGDLDFPLSLSIGVARFDPLNPLPLETLMEEADRRMYAEKSGRKARGNI